MFSICVGPKEVSQVTMYFDVQLSTWGFGPLLSGDFLSVMIFSSSAQEFYRNGPLAAQHAHLDLELIHMRNASSFTGLLPEAWGLQPMSSGVADLVY